MTFSRRPGARFNRGRIAEQSGASAPAVTPLTIFGSLAWWYRADLGVTISTGVSAWADQSGNGVNLAQGTGSAQPTLISSAINGQPALRLDGVDDFMSATWARSATQFYVCLVVKQISWTSNRALIADFAGGVGFSVRQVAGVSPQIFMANSTDTNGNGGGTLGSYFRLEAGFDAGASYLKIGSTNATGGASPGTSAGGGSLQLGSFNGGGLFNANIEIAEAYCFLGAPSAPTRAANDAYVTARYGAGLV